LTPTLIDDQYWFGVMMPSVDRVGRYFPLTIAARWPLPPGPALAPLEIWLEQIAHAALDCLAPNSNVDSLETTLAQLSLPSFHPPAMESGAGSDGVIARLGTGAGLGSAFANAAAWLLLREYRGASFWWPRIEANPTPILSVCRGLPASALLVRMLSGAL